MQLHRDPSLLSDQAPEAIQKVKRLVQFLGEPPLPGEVQQVNRLRMVERVRTLWLERAEPHFLHQQLRQQAERPEAMDELLQITVHLADQRASLSLSGSRIATAFKQAGGRLLLLGERGAGKSTLLGVLLRDLLLRVEQEREFPIPVLLKLASWTSKNTDLSSWLMAELQRSYQVPEKIARTWVNNHEILPLLDGLDELDAEDVEGCIQAIQSYAEKSRHIQMVVSCSQSVYEAQNKSLPVRGTVHIASLTAHQVEAYCEQVGGPFRQTHRVLQAPSQLSELITTPLALCLLTLTVNQAPFSPALQADSSDLLRDQLIEAYVEQQLAQPKDPLVALPQEGRRHWLVVLARQLKRVHQPIFSLDDLQPTWLGRGSRLLYSLLFVGGALLLMPLFFVLLMMWIFSQLPGPSVSLSTILFSSPIIWLPLLSVAFSAWPSQVKLKMRRPWQWKRVRRNLWKAHLGGLVNTVLWGVVSLSAGLQSNAIWPALPFGLAVGLLGWFLMVLLIGLMLGFSDETLPAQLLLEPGARVRESLKVGLLAALAGATVACLTFVGMIGIFAAAMVASHAALPASFFKVFAGITLGFAFVAALMAWSAFGGYAYLLHKILRLLLWRNRVLPRQTRAFLEDAAARHLLQPVGSGFQFVHPLVQEHFARRAEDHRG